MYGFRFLGRAFQRILTQFDLPEWTVGKKSLAEDIKRYICGKATRKLVPGTLQVGYGAVEMGVHRFHHPGHDDTAKCINLWQYKDGAWKITRVISYDHHVLAKWLSSAIIDMNVITTAEADTSQENNRHPEAFTSGLPVTRPQNEELWVLRECIPR